MPTSFYLVNAFTLHTSPHSGNQAAVVLLPPDHPKSNDDDWKRLTARDFNYAETAYITPLVPEEGKFGLRWWTPTTEVVLCGHATLAAAVTLFSLHPDKERLIFETRWSGDLIATRSGLGSDVSISLPGLSRDIISTINDKNSYKALSEVRDILIDAAPGVGGGVKNALKFSWGEDNSAIIELEEGVDLGGLKVDPKKMLAIGGGIIILTQCITSESTQGKLVIRSRVFGPGVGVDEDPVTGSAHAYLTSYYLSQPVYFRLPQSITGDKSQQEVVLDAYQLSERGGRLECRLEDGGRVGIVGRGVIWGKGELSV